MANVHAIINPLIARHTPYPPPVNSAAAALRAAKSQASPAVAEALEATAVSLQNAQGNFNTINATLRQNAPSVQQLYVTDVMGRVIAAIGDFEYNGVVTPNYFSEIHVGDPLNTGNPALALFNAANGQVTIGQNGAVNVLDPFGNNAAWIGTEADTLPVTGAVDNGSGLIRLTMTAHTYATGDTPTFQDVGGVPNATGIFTVTVIDANTVDLQNSVFVGTYTSGGTGTRILHVTGAANNGGGLVRIQTAVAHTYVTGDEVNIPSPGPGGVTGAVGQWIITFVDATHYDLQGSTFGGAYTSGGTCLRYFAGMLAQTIAIGPSFPNYKLRAFADGSLRISNAIISLVNGGNSIVLDPSAPSFTITNGTFTIQMDPTDGFLYTDTGVLAQILKATDGGSYTAGIRVTTNPATNQYSSLGPGSLFISGSNGLSGATLNLNNGQVLLENALLSKGLSLSITTLASIGAGQAIILSPNGGAIQLFNDSPAITLTDSGGQLTINAGGANQNIVLTPTGSGTVSATSDVTVSGVYRVSGTQVLGARRTGWSTPTATLSRAAIANGATLTNVTQGLAALITDLINTGVIGP